MPVPLAKFSRYYRGLIQTASISNRSKLPGIYKQLLSFIRQEKDQKVMITILSDCSIKMIVDTLTHTLYWFESIPNLNLNGYASLHGKPFTLS